MTRIIIAYLSTAVVFLAFDVVWLTQVGPLLYQPILGDILAPEPSMKPAVAFYMIYIAGLLYFAVLPGLAGAGWTGAAIKAGIFGFCAYVTFDLTSQAMLVVWSSKITLADMAWGTFVSAAGAAGGTLITGRLTRAAA
jgi:uncharacterized membrane protein